MSLELDCGLLSGIRLILWHGIWLGFQHSIVSWFDRWHVFWHITCRWTAGTVSGKAPVAGPLARFQAQQQERRHAILEIRLRQ